MAILQGARFLRSSGLEGPLRSRVKAGRRRNEAWVRFFDIVRLMRTADGRSRLWTMFVHRGSIHQTTTFTAVDRYSAIFDLAAAIRPSATRVLSFGCSTGEELLSLRKRFIEAEIVGVELNPRCRAIAKRRVAADSRISVIAPKDLEGSFDVICAMAVFQREPHKIAEMGVEDLTGFYPFKRFETTLRALVGRLDINGIFSIDNAQYRVEDSSVADVLKPVAKAPVMRCMLFGPNGRKLQSAAATTVFRKVRRAEREQGAGQDGGQSGARSASQGRSMRAAQGQKSASRAEDGELSARAR